MIEFCWLAQHRPSSVTPPPKYPMAPDPVATAKAQLELNSEQAALHVYGWLRLICDWRSLWLLCACQKRIENDGEKKQSKQGQKLWPTRRYNDLYFATFAIKNKYAIKQNDNGFRHMHYCPARCSIGNIC